MSSMTNSAAERAKPLAQEGTCLLGADDYRGGIAACTEAIELEPRSIGAYRTLKAFAEVVLLQRLSYHLYPRIVDLVPDLSLRVFHDRECVQPLKACQLR